MPHAKLSRLELQIVEILWNRGLCSICEIQEAFPESKTPANTTVQNTLLGFHFALKDKRLIRQQIAFEQTL